MMTRLIYRFLSVALLMVAGVLSGCTNRLDEPMRGGAGYLELNFLQPETRITVNPDGSGTFTDGDRVGLYIDNGTAVQYREMTYEGGVWTPRLKRSDFGTGTLVLSAHYPVQSIESPQTAPNHAFTLATTQNEATDFSAADMLFARTELAEGVYRAQLPFEHLFHRVRVELTNAGSGVSVRVRSVCSGEVNLLTGATTVSGAQYDWITPRQNSDGSYEAVVFPQSATPYQSGEGLLQIVNGDKQASFMAPTQTSEGQSLATLAAGQQTTFRLTITESGTTEPTDPSEPSEPVNPDVANKTLWIYGVHAPDFPGKENIPTYPIFQTQFPAGQWFRWDWTFSENQYLTWAPDCGWYDCNKSHDYSEGDENLCWAATASNMLIWWMTHNKPYVDAYTQRYGSSVTTTVAPQRTFERPLPEFQPLYPNAAEGSFAEVHRAPVFELFKQTFRDNGNWDAGAVNWFISGDLTNMVTPLVQGFPGFFSKVFTQDDPVAIESSRMPNAQKFNDFIIDAFLNRKSLGFTVYGFANAGSGSHSMTIWGAEFDENGQAAYLYYCDNNMADQDPGGAAIIRCKIVYAKDPSMYNNEYTYVQPLDNEEGVVYNKAKITALYSVDLRRDVWKQAFPDVVVEDE